MPRSEPAQDTVISSSDSSTSIRPVTPLPSTIRVTRARASAASSDSSTASATAASVDTVATTFAGAKPTPSSPRSPSVTTWKCTADLSRPGCCFSSSRSAAHFASPTVSPVASTEISCAVTPIAALSSSASRDEAERCSASEPACHQPLSDGPEVRRHPVEDEPGREADDERDEDDRQDHHQVPLRLLHRPGHEVRRSHLAEHIDREQDVARPVAVRVLRDVGDEVQPREVAAVDCRLPAGRILGERAQCVEEPDEDRELRQERQARC